MEDRLSRLEHSVESLRQTLTRLDERVRTLEARPAEPFRTAMETAAEEATPETGSGEVAVLPLLGRTLMVLGGAYLLRALTDRGFLPQTLGATLGIAYALGWIWAAHRAAGRGDRARRLSAVFYGAGGLVIAFPLIWEATRRFAIFSPLTGGAGLALMAGCALAVAWRHRLASLAWLTWAGGTAAALALLVGTHAPLPFGGFLLLLAVAVLWAERDRGWFPLPWLAAWLADFAVLLATVGARGEEHAFPLSPVLAVQLGLFATTLASATLSTLWLRRRVDVLEIVQLVVGGILGLGGALWLGADLPGFQRGVGFAALALGLTAYGVAFRIARGHSKRNYLVTSSLALVLLLLGVSLLVPRPAWALAVLAIAISWLGHRYSRVTLSLHGAFYGLGAAVASSFISTALIAFFAPPAKAWPPWSGAALAALAAVAACSWLTVHGDLPFWGRLASAPRVILLALTALGIGGLLLAALAPPVAGAPGGEGVDPGALAAIRTAVLTLLAMLLALASRLPRLREAASLIYPLFLVGGLKLLLEDFPHGRPLTLFLALALYGGALILAPRLRQGGA